MVVPQALDQGKPVLILDLKDETSKAKANNPQIREILRTLQVTELNLT